MRAWIRLPLDALIASKGITQSAVVVLAQICDRAAKAGTTTGITVTADELATEGGKSRRTVCRALTELQRLELIAARRTGRGSAYELCPGCVELFPEGTFDGSSRRQGGSGRRSAPRAPQENLSQIDLEYIAMSNRFMNDEPEPGQLEMEEST